MVHLAKRGTRWQVRPSGAYRLPTSSGAIYIVARRRDGRYHIDRAPSDTSLLSIPVGVATTLSQAKALAEDHADGVQR